MAIHSTRRNVEVVDRRRRVAELYLSGKMLTEIAETEGVDKAQISRDLKAIRQEWRTSTLLDFSEAQNRELAKLDALEQTHWRAWERSIGVATTIKVEYKGIKPLDSEPDTEPEFGQTVERSETSVKLVGDPRFLDGVYRCIAERCKILGIYAAVKNEVAGPNGTPLPGSPVKGYVTVSPDDWDADAS